MSRTLALAPILLLASCSGDSAEIEGAGTGYPELPATCDEAFAWQPPEDCEGSPVGTWRALVSCGHSIDEVAYDPPCEGPPAWSESWSTRSGPFFFSTETYSFDGVSDQFHRVVLPAWCAPDWCEIDADYKFWCKEWDRPDYPCAWVESAGCVCTHRSQLDHGWEGTVMEISGHEIITENIVYQYCRSGDLLWIYKAWAKRDAPWNGWQRSVSILERVPES